LPGQGVSGEDGGVRALPIVVDELLLRPWMPGDAEAVHRACQDPSLHRWLTGLPWPYRRSDAAAFVGELAPGMLAAGTGLHLGVFAGDELTGSVALHKIDRVAGTAELGYWSAPWARGRRITERAGRALLTRAFAAGPDSGPAIPPTRSEPPGPGLGLGRIDWRAAVGNHPSRLTALRLGFRMAGELPAAGPAAPDRWVAALLPGDLTAAGTDVADPVRRAARTFSGSHPTLPAGPVTLRPPGIRDVPGIVECRSDPESARWFRIPQPYTEADARRHVERNVPGRWARGTEAVFAVADGADAYAGSVDLRISAADPAVGEVGYLVSPRWRGRGHATAAVRAICRWGFAELGLHRIEWRAEVGNDASFRVAVKAGFTVEGLLRQALRFDGERRDCWVGSLVKGDIP
jgi:RimJ/RimL family protein N-acetyltransferase